MTTRTLAGKTLREEGITGFTGYRPAAREEDLDLDFFLTDAPLPARA